MGLQGLAYLPIARSRIQNNMHIWKVQCVITWHFLCFFFRKRKTKTECLGTAFDWSGIPHVFLDCTCFSKVIKQKFIRQRFSWEQFSGNICGVVTNCTYWRCSLCKWLGKGQNDRLGMDINKGAVVTAIHLCSVPEKRLIIHLYTSNNITAHAWKRFSK